MGSAVPVTLPGGYWLDGTCYREAELRPLSSGDEAFVVDEGEVLPPARWTTVLLARCLKRLGPVGPVTAEQVGSLTVGDREVLLLQLRRITIGERIRCLLRCPKQECGETVDQELNVGELLLPPYAHHRRLHETTVDENGTTYQVRFRLPTGADQESAAAMSHLGLEVAANLLLERCVENVFTEDGEIVDSMPPQILDMLPDAMAEADPQAELILNLVCPVCRSAFFAIFDTSTYFFQELQSRAKHLHREVHLLALYYHWSETEIMAMSTRKRRLYLGLLEQTFGEAREW